MADNNLSGAAAVVSRIVLTGKLVVKSPIRIGDGSGEENQNNDKDIWVQKNKEGYPFIPGTSMCGVLRCFVEDTMDKKKANLIFGGSGKDDSQSLIQIFDTVLPGAKVVYRDGVAINHYTGVAIDKKKYDYEVVDKGEGSFRLEAVIRQTNAGYKSTIREAIIRIKDKLTAGIQVGAMTSKGLGLVKLTEASLGCYNLAENEADVRAWFMRPKVTGSDASDRMTDKLETNSSCHPFFAGDFELRSTMIIRTENPNLFDHDNKHIDKVFLKNSDGKYVVPGASIKGVLRHQARYILDKLWPNKNEAVESFINNFMGYSDEDDNDKKIKSRFCVAESVLTDAVKEKVITRNRIDRITGGVIDSSLFTTVPVYQAKKGKKALHIEFYIKPENGKKSDDAEIGLALLLFRDLWQGQIALGGETGVGRGTLKGLSGTFIIGDKQYRINEAGEISSDNGDINALDTYVKALAQTQEVQ